MTRLELFARLCDLVDALQSQVRDLDHTPPRAALEALVARFEVLIDAVLTLETADAPDDDAPCPHCGEGACEASCTAALEARAGLPGFEAWQEAQEDA